MASPVEEPLNESAPLALDWADRLCRDDCAWYHGAWQTLRLLGVFHSIRSDDEFFLPVLGDLIGQGGRRMLICGAADYALLARLAVVAEPHLQELEVTVVDRCRTPLMLNAWFAERAGIEIDTVRTEVQDYCPAHRFDIICTHSFLCFFADEDRDGLVGLWHDWLVPGGSVVTAQRVRPDDQESRIAFSLDESRTLRNRAEELAVKRFSRLQIPPEKARRLAEDYGRHHWTWLIRTREDLQRPFDRAGFEWVHFAPPGNAPEIVDTPGTPQRGGSVRWRIHARKPPRIEY